MNENPVTSAEIHALAQRFQKISCIRVRVSLWLKTSYADRKTEF